MGIAVRTHEEIVDRLTDLRSKARPNRGALAMPAGYEILRDHLPFSLAKDFENLCEEDIKLSGRMTKKRWEERASRVRETSFQSQINRLMIYTLNNRFDPMDHKGLVTSESVIDKLKIIAWLEGNDDLVAMNTEIEEDVKLFLKACIETYEIDMYKVACKQKWNLATYVEVLDFLKDGEILEDEKASYAVRLLGKQVQLSYIPVDNLKEMIPSLADEELAYNEWEI